MDTKEMKERINAIIEQYEQEEYEYQGLTIREIRDRLGMSRTAFGRAFGIPVRTLESWESGERKPPEYLMVFMEKAIFGGK